MSIVRFVRRSGLAWSLLLFTGLAAPAAHGLDPLLDGVNDWVYLLQPGGAGATLADLEASGFDLVVMDYSADGDASGEWTAAQVAGLQAAGKVVVAYFSIGEAETYRYYWDGSWNDQPAPDPDAPSWLGPFNPLFPDNYKVRYWQTGWRGILFGTQSGPDRSYLDRILDQGFDGIYLDIIDAFEFWSSEVPERTRAQARADMVDLVASLAAHARETRNRPDFLVFPQNGEDLILDDQGDLDALGQSYLALIDGVGVEDVFYDERNPQPAGSVDYRTGVLDLYRGGGERLVLSVDYVWDLSQPAGVANRDRYNDFHSLAQGEGYAAFAATEDRELDRILEVEATGGFLFGQPRAGGSGLLFRDGFEAGDLGRWSAGLP